jgi:hypothetical protein
VIGALALFGFLVVWWVYRPGFMSVDSVAQLGEARSGAFTDFHPPILALIWRYLDKLWPGPIGMLILLDGLFWLGAAVFFRLLRWPLWAKAGALIVAGFQPAVFMLLGTIWKDTLMQATLLAATSAMLLAGPRPRARVVGLLLALPLMFIAIAARHNGIGAAWPLLAIPFFGVSWFTRWARPWQLAAALAAGLVLSLSLHQASGLLSRKIAEPTEYWQMTPIYDLVGMSLQVDEMLIDAEDGILSPRVDLARLRRVYDPRDHLRLYHCRGKNCTPALLRTNDPARLRALRANWKRAILAHPRAYLAHRWRVFRELLRFEGRRVDLSTGISKNRLGVPTQRSEAGTFIVDLLARAPNFPFYATWFYALLESALLVVGALEFFKRGRPLSLCFSASGLIYLATFFFATGAPDFRYSSWTILTTLLATCALAGFEGWPEPEGFSGFGLKVWRWRPSWLRPARDAKARSELDA